MNLLKEYIRSMLAEEAVSADVASSQGLGLIIREKPESVTYVVFKPKLAAQKIYDAKKAGNKGNIDEILAGSIVGFMQVKAPPKPGQFSAWWVAASAAEKGYGPLMYDIAMSDRGALTSDRYVVSTNAQKIWKHYKDDRKDIEHLEFDDQRDPKTKPRDDDAKLHKGGSENPLNYAYKGAHVNTEKLKKNYQHFLKWAKNGGMDENDLAQHFSYAGNTFFREKNGSN